MASGPLCSRDSRNPISCGFPCDASVAAPGKIFLLVYFNDPSGHPDVLTWREFPVR